MLAIDFQFFNNVWSQEKWLFSREVRFFQKRSRPQKNKQTNKRPRLKQCNPCAQEAQTLVDNPWKSRTRGMQRNAPAVAWHRTEAKNRCIWYHTEPSSYIIIKKVNFIFRVRTFHMIAPHTAGCQHVTWILGAFTNERPVTARRRFVNTRCTWERSNTRQL